MISIPEYEDASEAVKNNTANPLDLFIYHNEPAGRKDIEFREQLKAMLDYVSGLTPRAPDLPSAMVKYCTPVNGVHAAWCPDDKTASR